MAKYCLKTDQLKSVTLYCTNCYAEIVELKIEDAPLIYGYAEKQKTCKKCGAKLW